MESTVGNVESINTKGMSLSEEIGFVVLNRFTYSTRGFSQHALQHALNRISDAGFKGVEILADKPHAWLDTFAVADQERLQKQLKKHDLFVSGINADSTTGFWSDAPNEPLFEPSLVSPSREYREWRIAYAKKALRLGKALEAKNVSLTSGRALQGVTPEKAMKHLVEGLERVLEYAEQIGQRFSLTCEPTLLVEKTDELATVFATLTSPFFGANLDVAVAAAGGEDPCVAIEKLKGRIFNVRLADLAARKNYRRVPGDGDIDFDAIFKKLRSIAYVGPLTWDLQAYDDEPDTVCKKTFKFLKKRQASS